MRIDEAIKSVTSQTPFITRAAWMYLTSKPCSAPIKLQPTNSPDGGIVMSLGGACRGWQPRAEDLTADDWMLVT